MSDRISLHLVAAAGADLGPALDDAPETVVVLRRDPACFMRDASPHTASLETSPDELDTLVDYCRTLGGQFDRERSMALLGVDRVFLAPPAPTPVRYQYLMHRRADFTHEDYLARYETIHSQFGLRTPNLEGYVQLHVDLAGSLEIGAATGLAAEPCDSMSELHISSVAHFLEGITAQPDVGREATADEEVFVDRSRSFGFSHRLV